MTFLAPVEIDPNSVRPGWVALLIVLALGAATVLLWRNMGKQLKKIDFEGDDADAPAASSGPASPGSSADPAAAEPIPTAGTTSTPTQSEPK
ncbi:hypothetical protein ACIA49_18440 [Kribbella sp. NPDC051587]|jgi:hypothetical protein|uniref:hypothetical protein n=1 Tax=Kribbella sp. NPDC051587 TaxID=3364119 RepID=UPI003787C3F1